MAYGGYALVPALALAALLGAPAPSAAQQRDTVIVVSPVPEPRQESVELPDIERPTTPGGAFLRALALPGWGHASIGAYTRGGFYFAAETTAGFLLVRTVRRLEVAKDGRDLKEDRALEALLTTGVDPDSAAAQVELDPEVRRARRLVRSRRQQLEDWAALGVFFVFLAGADAFVSAHLRDFPEPIPAALEVAPRTPRGGVTVGLSFPLGRRSPGR